MMDQSAGLRTSSLTGGLSISMPTIEEIVSLTSSAASLLQKPDTILSQPRRAAILSTHRG